LPGKKFNVTLERKLDSICNGEDEDNADDAAQSKVKIFE